MLGIELAHLVDDADSQIFVDLQILTHDIVKRDGEFAILVLIQLRKHVLEHAFANVVAEEADKAKKVDGATLKRLTELAQQIDLSVEENAKATRVADADEKAA